MAPRLNATFRPEPGRPDRGRMVWWGDADPGAAAARHRLPEGAAALVELHPPGAEAPVPTPARLVPLRRALPALAALSPTSRTGDALLAWRAAARGVLDGRGTAGLAALMPPAAYAVPLGPGRVWAPGELLAAFESAAHTAYADPDAAPRAMLAARTADPGPLDLAASPRPYQRHGIAWLLAAAANDTGALLADDMGLGKTLQAIALLSSRDGTAPHLVVCPTSVVGNWAREIARFAPALRVVRHHGPGRATGGGFPPGAVVLTSYALLLRDAALLSGVAWDVVVLDEAQQIKNPEARTSRAARALPARTRVALTGTPVENRLAELWSIMDFAVPGLLGGRRAFVRRFAEPIEGRGDSAAAARLRELTAPYLLRRRKAEVAADLPPKIEHTVACALTAEQARLYRKAVAAAFDAGLGEGIERHGRVLALLTHLKQICDHPAHFLGQDGPLPGRSGKLDRTAEILGEVIAAGERALVFTQYRVMGGLLARHLAEVLGLPSVPFLHGGVGAPGREAMVDGFQSGDAPPVLLVSLKAGGTGLNLTAATHVVHYDRWWNPAVEDQATDRAHRIGQTRTVEVHKLVTAGTLEERIAGLLERKRSLAETVVGAGEDWISALDDSGLRALVELSDAEVTA